MGGLPLLEAHMFWRQGPQLCRCKKLLLDGKLGGQGVVSAATSSGPRGSLSLLEDEASSDKFLVDTGSMFSIIPHQSQKVPSGPLICAADRSPIACWGYRTQVLRAGGRSFKWKFLLAAVAFLILGATGCS